MSYIRFKTDKNTGKKYYYQAKTVRVGKKVVQKHIKYWGTEEPTKIQMAKVDELYKKGKLEEIKKKPLTTKKKMKLYPTKTEINYIKGKGYYGRVSLVGHPNNVGYLTDYFTKESKAKSETKKLESNYRKKYEKSKTPKVREEKEDYSGWDRENIAKDIITFFDKSGEVEITVAKLNEGKWEVNPSTIIFETKTFKTKKEAMDYAKAEMKKNTQIKKKEPKKPKEEYDPKKDPKRIAQDKAENRFVDLLHERPELSAKDVESINQALSKGKTKEANKLIDNLSKKPIQKQKDEPLYDPTSLRSSKDWNYLFTEVDEGFQDGKTLKQMKKELTDVFFDEEIIKMYNRLAENYDKEKIKMPILKKVAKTRYEIAREKEELGKTLTKTDIKALSNYAEYSGINLNREIELADESIKTLEDSLKSPRYKDDKESQKRAKNNLSIAKIKRELVMEEMEKRKKKESKLPKSDFVSDRLRRINRPSSTWANVDDIDIDRLYHGANNIYSDPEGVAISTQNDYVEHIDAVATNLIRIAETPEQKKVAEEEIKKYKDGYIKKFLAKIDADSRVASPFITGGSNFPKRQMEKRNATSQKRYDEFEEYKNKALPRAKRNVEKAFTGEISQREFEILKKSANTDLEVVQGIDEKKDRYRGFTRSAFVNSLGGKLERQLRNGNVALVEKTLEYVKQEEETRGMKKPIFTKRHGIFKKLEKAKTQEPTVKPTGIIPLKDYVGVSVVNNNDEDRVQLLFDEKPTEEIRRKLKSNGFHWSNKNEAWQRKNTQNGISTSKWILDDFFKES